MILPQADPVTVTAFHERRQGTIEAQVNWFIMLSPLFFPLIFCFDTDANKVGYIIYVGYDPSIKSRPL